MSEKFKEKWTKEPTSPCCIDINNRDWIYVKCNNGGLAENVCDQIVRDHNACRGLARPELIPVLIASIKEQIKDKYIFKLIAQIEGGDDAEP